MIKPVFKLLFYIYILILTLTSTCLLL